MAGIKSEKKDVKQQVDDEKLEFTSSVLPSIQKSNFTKSFIDRILKHLNQLSESRPELEPFNKVNRLEHCLQSATLAYNAGEDDEYILCCLLHDIGDLLAPFNHGEFAATLLEPFISEKNYWLIANHHLFQGYYYFEKLGLNKNLREKFLGHPWYNDAIKFCDLYDMPAFNPEMQHMTLKELEPIIFKVLLSPKKTVWLSENSIVG